MDVANELLDAIEIIVDKKVRENTAQIYPGICKSVSGNSCVMSINGKDNTIQFYGSIPTVGAIYRVFVPDGNMSMAFAITGNDDRKGLHYSNPNLLDNWYFGNPVNQRGQTSYTSAGYGIDRWKLSLWQSTSPSLTISDGYITLSNNTAEGTLCSCTIQQIIDNPEQFAGQTVTFSVLLGAVAKGSGKLVIAISVNGSTESATEIKIANENSVVSRTLTLPSEVTSLNVYIGQNANNAGKGTFSIQLKAAKLELGTTQTIAHQENGNWRLNEIPDFGEQLRRCQRYLYRINSSDKQYHSGTYTIVPPFVVNTGGTRAAFQVPSPLMRKKPSISASGMLYIKSSAGAFNKDISSLTLGVRSNDEGGTVITLDTTDFPANTFGVVVMDDCDIILNAEL